MIICFVYLLKIVIKTSQGNYSLKQNFKKDFIYLFLERGREGEREAEKHQCVVASRVPSTGDLARNPSMCPDWESNHDLLVHRSALNPLSHTSQDSNTIFKCNMISAIWGETFEDKSPPASSSTGHSGWLLFVRL